MSSTATAGGAVAIIGRPNVGKSAIFNRLVGRNIAIVHAERGVTRDRLIAEAQWQGRRFELIDTGGLGQLTSDPHATQQLGSLEHAVFRQVEAALQDAAAILFVVDVNTGLLPQDEEVAAFLRASGRPIFLAANKADNPARDLLAVDFTRLGFPVFPVSALGKRGFDVLMPALLKALPEQENPTLLNPLKVVFVGRPNVGKSSVINRLLRDDRVIVSVQPGTTRDSITIPFSIGGDAMARHYFLTDTAGIRRVGKIRNSLERLSLTRTERSIARAEVVGLILDASQGPTAQDKAIAAKIIEHQKGCVLIINKKDLIKNVPVAHCLAALRREMPFCAFMPALCVSAKTGWNIRGLIDQVDRVALHIQAKLPTGVLNRVLLDACARVQPPRVGGKRLKIFYATQVQTRPTIIRLFVNYPQSLTPAYQSYLIGCLRTAFGLDGVPLLLDLQARRRPAKLPQTALKNKRL